MVGAGYSSSPLKRQTLGLHGYQQTASASATQTMVSSKPWEQSKLVFRTGRRLVPSYTNGTDDCALKVLEYNVFLPLPGERRIVFGEGPMELRDMAYMPELSRSREYGWVKSGVRSQFPSSATSAETCVIQFFDLPSRASRGEITPLRSPADRPNRAQPDTSTKTTAAAAPYPSPTMPAPRWDTTPALP
jgi:hypothetical protein